MTTQHIVNATAHHLPLPDAWFHSCITSPPYFSLRRYEGAQDIDWPEVAYHPMPGLPPLTVEAMRCPLGLEPTPEAYIGHMVLVFRDVWRVLRDDGTAWVVMGDSYCGYKGENYGTHPETSNLQNKSAIATAHNVGTPYSGPQSGDLMLIPHRLALALQGDGWLVRNDVVWAKKAPMPESVAGWRWERCKVKVKSDRPQYQPSRDGAGGGAAVATMEGGGA